MDEKVSCPLCSRYAVLECGLCLNTHSVPRSLAYQWYSLRNAEDKLNKDAKAWQQSEGLL